jgi:NAD(P)-dependent dehydrogenase (short-subunit alcohol dehydrogenase family)
VDIKGKVALITGAAVRVGRAIALELARRGARVVVHYHASELAAHEVVSIIEEVGQPAVALRADLSQSQQVEALVSESLRAFGRIDILVNNAAIFYRTPFLSVSEEDWDRHLDLNLKGVFLCCQAIAPVMLSQGGGCIINIADVAGVRPWAEYIPYCVSKAGVMALTQGLAKALAPTVLVNAVAPGTVLFPENYSEEDKEKVRAAIPLGREGTPEDVARTVAFLAESDFITGAVIPVDGGRLVK